MIKRKPEPPPGIDDDYVPSDWENLKNEAIVAREMGDHVNWRLGDLACSVEIHYGEHKLQQFAAEIDVPYESLRQYKRVDSWGFSPKRLLGRVRRQSG